MLFEDMVDSIYDDIAMLLLRVVKIDSEKAQSEVKEELNSLNMVHEDFGSMSRRMRRTVERKKGRKRMKVIR